MSVWGNSLQHLGFLPLLLRQFSSVHFLIISFMSPLRQRGLYWWEKKHVLELMRTVICKKEKCQLNIPQLLQADSESLLARTYALL